MDGIDICDFIPSWVFFSGFSLLSFLKIISPCSHLLTNENRSPQCISRNPLFLSFFLLLSSVLLLSRIISIIAAISSQSISSWIRKTYFLQILLHMYSYDYHKIFYL